MMRLTSQMLATSRKYGATFERVATGNRINRPGDDAAGLAIADKLRIESRIMTAAMRNANDALSMINTTDSALSSVNDVLTRMGELAAQAGNSTYSDSQRSAMQLEFAALGSEIDRISSTTSFNGVKLLSNSADMYAQIGISGDAASSLQIQSSIATLSALGLGNGTVLTYSLTGATSAYAITAANSALAAVQTALDGIGTQRGRMGASSARLQSAITNLTTSRENSRVSESYIRDADLATDSAELVKLQVLQQAQSALFGQANQMWGRVYDLIRG
jgi:flagellin